MEWAVFARPSIRPIGATTPGAADEFSPSTFLHMCIQILQAARNTHVSARGGMPPDGEAESGGSCLCKFVAFTSSLCVTHRDEGVGPVGIGGDSGQSYGHTAALNGASGFILGGAHLNH